MSLQRFVKKYQINQALIPTYPDQAKLDDEIAKEVIAEEVMKNGRKPTDRELERGVDNFKLDAAAVKRLKDELFIKDFVAKWRFMGCILTDMDVSSRFQKLFNLNVRGRSRVFNLWTTRINGKYERKMARDRVQKGDTLYLTLKKVPVDDTTYLQPDGTTMGIIPSITEDNMVWQIRAERMTHGKAPYAPRLNNDIHREPQLNIVVGRVLNALSKKPEEHFQRRAFREHTQMGHLPMVEVALHTDQL